MDVSRERTELCGVNVSQREKGRLKEKDALYYLLSALWGFVTGIATLPFSASPFGIAALAVGSRYLPGIAAGVFLSCAVARNGYELPVAYAALLICRVAFSSLASAEKPWRERLFGERIAQRSVSAATGALALGVYRLVRGGFLYYDVIGTVLTMAISALLVPLWYVVVPKRKDERHFEKAAWRTVATCSMAALTVYAFSGMRLFGVSLSVFFALLLTLFAVRRKGVNFGVLIAICTGVFVSVTYAPLFILAAVIFALLQKVSVGFACFATLAAGMAWGIYMTGIGAVSELFSGLFAASVIFPVLDKLFFAAAKTEAREMTDGKDIAVVADRESAKLNVAFARLDDTARLIKDLCGALSSLSERLRLTESKFQSASPARVRVEGGSLSARISADGATVTRKNPRRQLSGKENIAEVGFFECACGCESPESTVGVLEAISDRLASVMRVSQVGYVEDSAASLALYKSLCGVFRENDGLQVSVFQKDAVRAVVSVQEKRALENRKADVLSAAREALGACFDCGEVVELDGRYYLSLQQKPFLAATVSGRRKNAPDEKEFCGDSFDAVGVENGNLCAFISDGMGSGREAARASEIGAAFLGELLPSGFEVSEAVEMFNGFLRSRNRESTVECTATADIAHIDFYRSRVRFYKSGAAPTYVFRDGKLRRFSAHTMPIGIMERADVATSECEIIAGDVIVMVSDGVTEGREECPELCEFIRSRLLTHTADQLAEAIIGYTQKRGCRDDATAVVIKIERNDVA